MKKTFLFTAFGKSIQVTNENTSSPNTFVSETEKYFQETIFDNIPDKFFTREEMDILGKESSVEFQKHIQEIIEERKYTKKEIIKAYDDGVVDGCNPDAKDNDRENWIKNLK